MHMSHSLLECPLYNCATLILDTTTRIITHASPDMLLLLDNEDLTGTPWPSKQDQQLCFTTLIKLKCSQRQKRLLTCEHINDKNPAMTTIHCAEMSKLETTSAFFYALTTPPPLRRTCQFNYSQNNYNQPTIILRMSLYGVIQSAFFSPTTTAYPSSTTTNNSSWILGKPLMRFIHNDDIPILCGGLRQVTRRYQQDDSIINSDGRYWANGKNDITMVSFDIRCNFDSKNTSISLQDCYSSIDNEKDDSRNDGDHYDTLYHFSTTITSSQDILCVIRPSRSTTTSHNSVAFSQATPAPPILSSSSSSSTATSFSSPRSWRIPRTQPTTEATTAAAPTIPSSCHQHGGGGGMPRVYSALIHLSQLVRSPYSKGKDMVNGLQQALWDAVEQGWVMLAHYLAAVMVLALHYYRMARYPSFWLETSELALRCLVAETTSRHELDRLLSWLDWSGVPRQQWLGSALDHGSEWLFSLSKRSHVYSF